MIKSIFPFLCSAAILCLCLSCRAQKQPETFFNTYLTPVELNGVTLPDADDNSRPTLIFNTAQNRIGGYSGCNNFFGNYQLKGKTIIFSEIGATKRACIGVGDKLERAMLSVLRNANAVKIDGDILQLLNDKEVIGKFVILKEEKK